MNDFIPCYLFFFNNSSETTRLKTHRGRAVSGPSPFGIDIQVAFIPEDPWVSGFCVPVGNGSKVFLFFSQISLFFADGKNGRGNRRRHGQTRMSVVDVFLKKE